MGRTAPARSCSTPAPRPSTTTRSATPSASPPAARPSRTRHRHRPLRRRRLARRRLARRLRPPHRAGPVPQARALRQHLRQGRRTASRRRRWCSEIKPLLPPDAEVKTGDAQAKADAKDTNEGLKFITYFLLGFGGLALFVGAFVIFNTLSITVAQRSREFATLRTLGASRRQVLRSVVLEGLVVGLLASVIGLVMGLGIAKGMNALFVAFGIDLPKSGTVLATRTIDRQHARGHGRHGGRQHRARRCAPRASRRSRRCARARRPRRPGAASARTAPSAPSSASLAMLALALFGGVAGGLVALLLGVGVLSLFVGIAMLAPRLVKPLAALVGLPAAPPRRRPRPDRPRQLDAQPRPHGLHGRGADDRPRARHGRRHAGRRPARLDRVRRREAGPRRLRRHRQGRRGLVPGRLRQGRRRLRRRARRLRACAPTRPGGRRRRHGQRHRPGHDRPLLPVRCSGSTRRASATATRS